MAARHCKSDILRIATYTRMSSDDQQFSIESQDLAIDSYAQAQQFEIVARYSDAGIAGDMTADRRPGLQKLLAEAKQKKFDAVLVRDPSRLTRSNSIKGSAEVEPLYDAGIVILTVTGLRMDLADMAGRIQLQLWFEMAHADNRSRSLNVTNGILRSAKAGNWIGRIPLGYRLQNQGKRNQPKRLVLGDPDEIATVRRIFNEYSSGRPMKQIAEGLEKEGILTSRGKRSWHLTVICGILQNPVYVGDFAFSRQSSGKYYKVTDEGIAASSGRQKNDKGDWIVLEGIYPKIIERSQFEQVQSRISRNKSSINNSESFLFSSRLKCGECDRIMHGQTSRQGIQFYVCPDCQRSVKEEIVAESLIPAIVEAIDRQELLKELQSRQSSPKSSDKQRKKIEAEIAKQTRKLVLVDYDRDLVLAIKKEVDRLKKELESLRSPDVFDLDDARKVQRAMEKLPDLLRFPRPKLRPVIREILDHVKLFIRSEGRNTRKRYTLERGEAVLDLPALVGAAECKVNATTRRPAAT
ncbi:MAG: hypothetical protein FJ247_12745 [Nitrospira sp.]|nr:hypothetical protein [Nitrospira sp.]